MERDSASVGWLQSRWHELCLDLVICRSSAALWWSLLERQYVLWGRERQVLPRIARLLRNLQSALARGLVSDLSALKLATFFHCSFWSPRLGDEECAARSAEFLDSLGELAASEPSEDRGDGQQLQASRSSSFRRARRWILLSAKTTRCSPPDGGALSAGAGGDEDDDFLLLADLLLEPFTWGVAAFAAQCADDCLAAAAAGELAFSAAADSGAEGLRGFLLSSAAASRPLRLSSRLRRLLAIRQSGRTPLFRTAFFDAELVERAHQNLGHAILHCRAELCAFGAVRRVLAALLAAALPALQAGGGGWRCGAPGHRLHGLMAPAAALLLLAASWLLASSAARLAVKACLVAAAVAFSALLAFGAEVEQPPYGPPRRIGGTVALAGSFNPPHHGHLDMLRHLAECNERVVAIVAVNACKAYAVPPERRVELLRCMIAALGLRHVEARLCRGPVFRCAHRLGASTLCRGWRSWRQDALAEKLLELENWVFPPLFGHRPLRTCYLTPPPSLNLVSSTEVRRLCAAKASIEALVPAECAAQVVAAYSQPAGGARRNLWSLLHGCVRGDVVGEKA